MTLRRAVLVTLVVLASQAMAAASDSNLRKLEELGQAIHAKDRAAWLATDRLRETFGKIPDGLVGWVTLPDGDGWRVRFMHEVDGTYCSRFEVPVDADGAGPLATSEACAPLTGKPRAMFVAREAALDAMDARCSDAYNSVVLPHDGAEAAWVVYLLAATTEPGKVLVGGHVRVLVGEGGDEIVDYRPLSNSCLTLGTQVDDGELYNMTVTHFLDDHPIETHVFLSLVHGVDFIVLTEPAMWSVSDGEIRLLMDGEDWKAYLGRAEATYEESQDSEGPGP